MELNSRSSTLVPDAQTKKKGLPEDWITCVHPQGWVYFYNPTLKVVTDQDIRDNDVYNIAQRTISEFQAQGGLEEHIEVQLHVQTHLGAAGIVLAVNHKECVASYERVDVIDENLEGIDPNTLNRRRRLYWNHLWNHPAHVPTPDRALPDASDALTWFYVTDNLISGSRSVVPFSKTECEDLSRVLRDMSSPQNDQSTAKTVFVSWFLREVCSFRDSESYGQFTQKVARTIHDDRGLLPANSRRSVTISPVLNFIITALFFGIPRTYYVHVKMSSEYRGRLANVQQNWETYIERLVREYSHFLLISTVLLSATVSFLSVPEIAGTARVSATLSTLASLGSIIVGVFSIWRHQTNTRTADSFTYMHNAQHRYLGFHGHAMILSLPPVLLVWAIVAFTLSIVAYSLQGLPSNDSLTSASGWTILGVFIVLLVAVVAALYTFSIIWMFQRPSLRLRHSLKELWHRRITSRGNSGHEI